MAELTFGIKPEGFRLKRLPEIIDSVQSGLRASLGDLDFDPDAPMGQVVGTICQPLADAWGVLADVYSSRTPNGARGVALDNLVALNGLVRLPATSSRVLGILLGTEGTVVPAGSVVTSGENRFVTALPVTIRAEAVSRAKFSIGTPTAGLVYSVGIDGVSYPVVAGGGDTAEDIANALAALIIADVDNVTVDYSNSPDIVLTCVDAEQPFFISVSATVSLTEIWTPAEFFSESTGPVPAQEGTLTNIVTSVANWDEVDNLVPATLGRLVETDVELRQRRLRSIRITGVGPVEAIVANLLEVANVTQVNGYENTSDVVYNGLQPKSMAFVVTGGTDTAIAETLWQKRPGGIYLNGTTSKDIVDSTGVTQTVRFYRPTPKYIHLDVLLYTYAEGETFPIDGITRVKQALYEYGLTYQPGKDILWQRWLLPIYTVSGISEVSWSHAKTDAPGDTPSFGETTLTLALNEYGAMSLDRINVTVFVP